VLFLPPSFIGATTFFDRVIGGDKSNTAVYFPETYYCNKSSVEELKTLAAHAVLEAGSLNPTQVSGLDVLIGKNGEPPHFVDDKELEALRRRSETIHESLMTSIFHD
jgi:20S proteasome alpha/beta subunit